MKCSACSENWKVEKVCPECWITLLENMETNWICKACGEDLFIQAEVVDEGQRVISIYCPKCKTMYIPMGG